MKQDFERQGVCLAGHDDLAIQPNLYSPFDVVRVAIVEECTYQCTGIVRSLQQSRYELLIGGEALRGALHTDVHVESVTEQPTQRCNTIFVFRRRRSPRDLSKSEDGPAIPE